MHCHGPSCLKGPVSRNLPWWAGLRTMPMDTPLEQPRLPDSPIRQDLVERVRREIAAGTYETPEKWEIAFDRLLDRLKDE